MDNRLQFCKTTRMDNKENFERNRLGGWSAASRNSSSQSTQRSPSVDLSKASDNGDIVSSNEQSGSITSSISSPAKRQLLLLGKRYSSYSASSSADAQSVMSSPDKSFIAPVSPPSLRNRLDTLSYPSNYSLSFSPIQLLLLHASQYETEVGSESNNGDYETPVLLQGGHLLKLMNQLSRNSEVHSPPRHDDDDGLLSSASSFISTTQIFCSDKEKTSASDHDVTIEDDKQESDYFSSFCNVQTILSKLDSDDNTTLSKTSNVAENSEDNFESNEDEDWGLLRCVALSILVVISILLALSGLSLLQAMLYTWVDSFSKHFWGTIQRCEFMCFERLNELYSLCFSASRLRHNWYDSIAIRFVEILEKFEILYLGVLNDLLRYRSQISSFFSFSNLASSLMQQLRRLSGYASYASKVDVASVVLEQIYRGAKAYYSAVDFFKTAQNSAIDFQASTAVSWNTTLFLCASYLQQVRITVSESKNWFLAPLSDSVPEHFLMSKASLTTPIMFDAGFVRLGNNTAQYDENILQMINPPFWRRQSRAFFVKSNFLAAEMSLRRLSGSHFENDRQCPVRCENNTLVVSRIRNSKHQRSKIKTKERSGRRDYYNSILHGQPDEKDIFDGVDIMSMASDAINRWWHQHW